MGLMETVIDIPAEHEANVFGQFDVYAKKIERALHVTLIARGESVKIMGDALKVEKAKKVLDQLVELSKRGNTIQEQNVDYTLALVMEDSEENVLEIDKDIICHTLQGKPIKPKTLGQKKYVDAIRKQMIVFGLGPAGTGKTYLAMAMAITAFKNNEVGRIILTRPAIEAGEKLGFLPGDLQSKIDPYLRPLYDALYQMNIECDFVWPESDNLEQYKAIFIPALYAAPDELLERLKQYVADGGTLVATFKTAFANENIKVSHEMQPHILSNCFGINYQQFTFPKNVGLTGSIIRESGADEADKKNETKEIIETEENTDVPATAKVFMELLMPQEAEVLAFYDHYNWKEYAAITKNHYEKGTAIYIGCMTDDNTLKAVITEALRSAELELPEYRWPVIVRKGTNDLGKCVRYILNYSAEEQKVSYYGKNGTELLSGESVQDGESITVSPWNIKIVEEA